MLGNRPICGGALVSDRAATVVAQSSGQVTGFSGVFGTAKSVIGVVGVVFGNGNVNARGQSTASGRGIIASISALVGVSGSFSAQGRIASISALVGNANSFAMATGNIAAAGVLVGHAIGTGATSGSVIATSALSPTPNTLIYSIGEITSFSSLLGDSIARVGVKGEILSLSSLSAYSHLLYALPFPGDSVVVYQGSLIQPFVRAVSMAQFWSFVAVPTLQTFPISLLPVPRVSSLSDGDWILVAQGEDGLVLRCSVGQMKAYYVGDVLPPPPAVVGWVSFLEGTELVRYVQGSGGSGNVVDLNTFLQIPIGV